MHYDINKITVTKRTIFLDCSFEQGLSKNTMLQNQLRVQFYFAQEQISNNKTMARLNYR